MRFGFFLWLCYSLPKLYVIFTYLIRTYIFFRMFGQHQTLDQQDLSTAHQPQTLEVYTVLHHLKVQFSDHPVKVCVLFEYSVFTNSCQFFETLQYILTIQLVNSNQSTTGVIIGAVLSAILTWQAKLYNINNKWIIYYSDDFGFQVQGN